MFRTSPEYRSIETLAEEGGSFSEVPMDTLVALTEQGYFLQDLETLFN